MEHRLGKYTLVYNMRALRAAEEQIGPLPAIMADPFKAGSATTVTVLIWAGLRQNHACTMDEASDIIDEVTLGKAAEIMAAALRATYPTDKGKKTGKPPAS